MRPAGLVRELLLAALLAAAGSPLFCQAGHGDEAAIGSVSAISPAATGTLSTGASSALAAGADIFFQEQLATADAGRLHIDLADESAIDLSPNSELTIDKFVYDPTAGSGEMAGNLAKGLFRYVGGKISKSQDVVFTTPSASIAIRGSSMLVEVTPEGETKATFLGGAHMRVSSGGQVREVTRPNFFVSVPRRGATPSLIQRARRADIERAMERVRRHPGEALAGANARFHGPQAPQRKLVGKPASSPQAPGGKAAPANKKAPAGAKKGPPENKPPPARGGRPPQDQQP